MASPVYSRNKINRYPSLVDSVTQRTLGYESSFKEDEDYAMVEVNYALGAFIPSFIEWMLRKEASEGDINLIDVNQFSSYQLIPPPPEEEDPINLKDESNISEVKDKTEITFPKEIIFEEKDFLPPISLSDRQPITSSPILINMGGYQTGNTYGYVNTGVVEPTKPIGTGNYTGERRTAGDGSSWVWIPFQGGWTRA